MLGSQVASDLELSTLSISTSTSWGKERFTSGLHSCTSEWKEIKRRQLQLLVIRTEPTFCKTVRTQLDSINTAVIDDCLKDLDPRINEQLTQVLWKKDSIGNFLNTSPAVLNALCVWKTICLPTFAIVMPLFMIVIPFFIQRVICPGQDFDAQASQYLETVREVLLKQIRIPTVLKSRHPGDRLGFIFESLFIGLTLSMFIVSICNQISNARHLRAIWFDIDMRGKELRHIRTIVLNILTDIKGFTIRKQRGILRLIEDGEAILEQTKLFLDLDNVTTFGAIWNNSEHIQKTKDWLANMDVLVSIASLPHICFPSVRSSVGIDLIQAYHPSVKPCIPNNLTLDSHCIVTGPNRGGKSTFCKTIGISIITAQSWGFAYAKQMTWSPFRTIHTVLEPCGKLGIASTFEAEIEFAKIALDSDVPALIMMDEIFHSTNAKDGVIASKVFLDRLYKRHHVVSVISTHYSELANHYQNIAKPYQLVTEEDSSMNLTYTYTVADGISDKSSVMEILKERGLFCVVTT